MRTVYIDESGRAGDTAFVGMGACDADPETWLEFDLRWKWALATERTPYLHMKEFSGCRGPFKGWTEARRRRLLRGCLETLDGLEIVMMSSVLKVDDFRRLAPQTQSGLVDPYFCCFQECLFGSALSGYMGSPGDIVHIIYSQQDEFRSRFVRMFEQWRATVEDGKNLKSLSFADMRNTPGLQLADLLAYEATHYYHLTFTRPDLPPRLPFKALCDYQISLGGGAMFKYMPYWALQMKAESGCWQEIQNVLWSDLEMWGHMLRELGPEPARPPTMLRRIAQLRTLSMDRFRRRRVPRRLVGRPTLKLNRLPPGE